jgi:uncharacterized membrane protein required for colicin V production
MNWIDVGILLVLGLSVLFGLYKGFVKMAAGLISFVLAWVIAISCYPLLANVLKGSETLTNTVQYYIEDTSRLADQVNLPVDSFQTMGEIEAAVESAQLPGPISDLLTKNISDQAFLSDSLTTMGDYLNQTVVNFAMNLIAFLILFLAVKIICAIVLKAIDFAMKLPVLTTLNSALGCVFGFFTGLILLYVIFSLLPIFLMSVPSPAIEEMLDTSLLTPLFYKANIISGLLKGI